MNELRKTIMFAVAGIVLALIAVVTAPKQVTPDAFFDQGEPFFPDFDDPNAARTLEVIDFDEETGAAVPFKVTFQDGKWTIPSHHDYPADGEDRLAQTAAGVIGITRDDFRTDNVSDHAACGVVDPLDNSTTTLAGRGQRVTIKGENDVVLADFIIGNEVEGREGFRLVRVPGQKRVYGARMDIDISTKFSDWIESDLLLVDKDKINNVTIRDYTIDERTGRVEERDVITLAKFGEDWRANNMGDDQEVDRFKMGNLLTALDELKIVGVRPKPAGLTATLARSSEGMEITQSDMLSLQSKGYFFSRDGALLSNEGEVQATTEAGVTYTLRFGEIVYGSGVAVSAGAGVEGEGAESAGENRYLFITTRFDRTLFPEPSRPENTDFLTKPDSVWTETDREMKALQDAHDQWRQKVENGQARSTELNERFARWYYVISQDSFEKLRVTRTDLLKEKPKTE